MGEICCFIVAYTSRNVSMAKNVDAAILRRAIMAYLQPTAPAQALRSALGGSPLQIDNRQKREGCNWLIGCKAVKFGVVQRKDGEHVL
jgi:hypothetical protein